MLTKDHLKESPANGLVTVNLLFTKLIEQIKAVEGTYPSFISNINIFKPNLFTYPRYPKRSEIPSQEESKLNLENEKEAYLETITLQILGQFNLTDFFPDPSNVELVLFPSGSVVTDIDCIEDGDNVMLQKRFKYTDQKSVYHEEDDQLLAEELRLYEEEQRTETFKKVEFFRKLKEFTRLNKQYVSLCNSI